MNERPNLLADEDLPPEPRQKRSKEKHTRIKEAALACFGENGYESSSIDEIAARADLAVGGFYLHFRSKRQLLLALMDELLEHLSQLNLRPSARGDIRAGLHDMLSKAFSADLRYLGAYRAWQEAVLSDRDLIKKNEAIHAWTTARVTAVFTYLSRLPGARRGADIPSLARAMDAFFWTLLAQAVQMSGVELQERVDASTHLIYHAIFTDKSSRPSSRTSRAAGPQSPSRGRRPQQ